MELLQKFSPELVYKKRNTPGEPESFLGKLGRKPEDVSQKDMLSVIGSLLWLSLRTRPDISWESVELQACEAKSQVKL